MQETNPSPDAVAATIECYLGSDSARLRRAWMSEARLERPVGVNREAWRRWFTLPGPLSEPVLRALDVLRENTGEVPRGTHVITRSDLADLAASARTRDGATTLFVATMMWGSGSTNGRGPRYTDAARRDPRLTSTLAATAALAAEGYLAGAYARFDVNGIGPSFFTKWLWASSLHDRPARRPLILDQRVIDTLHRLGWYLYRAGATRAARYESYVVDVHEWADLLRTSSAPALSAEHIEHLLFDRRPGNLADWLSPVAASTRE